MAIFTVISQISLQSHLPVPPECPFDTTIMDASKGSPGAPTLSWLNVAVGLAFIAFDALLSLVLGLRIGSSLVVAALRCVLQLSVMALLLDRVFAADSVWGVAGIAFLLNVLGATEATFNKSKRRFANMVGRSARVDRLATS